MMIFFSFFSFELKKTTKNNLFWWLKKKVENFSSILAVFLPPFKLCFGDKDHVNVEQMCDFVLYLFLGHTLVTFLSRTSITGVSQNAVWLASCLQVATTQTACGSRSVKYKQNVALAQIV